MSQVQSRTFVWHFDAPAQAVWPILADTERFNEAAGLVRHEIEEIVGPDASMTFVGRAKVGPFALAWEDIPSNWVANRWFDHARVFRGGPFRALTAHLALTPEAGGTRADYTLTAEPANILGTAILKAGFLTSMERKFGALADAANAFCRGEAQTEFEFAPPRLAPGGGEHMARAVARIEESAFGHGLAGRLADFVSTRPEVDIRRIRPIALARQWGVRERHVIELCLEAAREQMLAMRWDLLCPRCQVAKATSATLDQLPSGAHCSTCNIDYGRDYTRNIELAFYPSNLVRAIDGREFCLFGPWSTPHVVCQITVEAKGRREVEVELPAGGYRLRTLEAGPETQLDLRPGEVPSEVVLRDGAISARPDGTAGRQTFVNDTAQPRTFIVEELGWRRDALTAERVTTMQAFREICGTEMLRPGDSLAVDSVTFMFTDLQGSTALYEKVGDVQAFSLVREFFSVLARAIRSHNGAVVKTIGDAVHGAFANPGDAVRAAIAIQDGIDAFNARSGRTPIGVKVGLHVGRCISVTLNERLDYYGTSVNKAARLADQSRGGDIVLSREIAEEPSVRDIVGKLSLVEDSAPMKGFDQPMPFLRIPRDAIGARRAQGGFSDQDEGPLGGSRRD